MKFIQNLRDLIQHSGAPADSTKAGDADAQEKRDERGAVPSKTQPPPKMELPAVKPAEWKTHPVPDEWCPALITAQYPELKRHIYADNYGAERVLPEGWRVIGATRRGKTHAHQGTHREDAIGFNAGRHFTVLCIADGAGSSPLSRLGSHVAVRQVIDFLTSQLPAIPPDLEESRDQLQAHLMKTLSQAVLSACLSLQELALKAKASSKDFRCTLLSVLQYRGKQHELALTNQIGDGAICVLFKNKEVRRCGTADSGEFSGEVSCFVPDECAREKAAQIQAVPTPEAIECILLCSDGVEDPFYPMEKMGLEIFRQLHLGVTEKLSGFNYQCAQPAVLSQDTASAALAQWLGFEKRGENDDRTLLILHRYPSTVKF